MTTNALLSYLGVALVFAATVFFVVGIARSRNPIRASRGKAATAADDHALLAAQRADVVCGTVLLAIALLAEVISVAHGGPASGEPSGNLGGAVVVISLATFGCVVMALVVRNWVLVRLRRKFQK